MEAELLVSRALGETRVALLEHGVTQEVYLERDEERSVVGNIYQGRVTRVLPGMQAAFIDIGLERAAFLYMDDLNANSSDDDRDVGEDLISDEETASSPRPAISEPIFEGQTIAVQVVKAPFGTKGARVNSHITIPGRCVVYMPTTDRLAVSRKIVDEEERKRLKTLMGQHQLPGEGGFIARTACEGASSEDIARDAAFVRTVWSEVKQGILEKTAPALLLPDLDLVLRSTRDLFTDRIQRLWVNQPTQAQRIRNLLQHFAPHLAERVHLHEGKERLFQAFSVEQSIDTALSRSVPLKSGGSVIFDEAEALTAIDVNTGSFVGSRNLEATILKTNLEAAETVAHQIRLRNLGGIIIVDFIDMQLPENRQKVHDAFTQAVGFDRARTHILPMTEFGLVELTRKRVRPSLGHTLTDPCPYCESRGWIRSQDTICRDILLALDHYVRTEVARPLLVTAMPEVASMLTTKFRNELEELEQQLKHSIVVEAHQDYHQESFEITVRV